MSAHQLVLRIENDHLSWRLICPTDGTCSPANVCVQCGRTYGDESIGACYDCRDLSPEPGECWAQSWVGELTAEEVLHGTVEVVVPVDVLWTGDSLEAHVVGPPTAHGGGAQ